MSIIGRIRLSLTRANTSNNIKNEYTSKTH
jgi:hypothetical protein